MWQVILALFIGGFIGGLAVALCAANRIRELEWRCYRLRHRVNRYRGLAALRGEKIDRLCDAIMALNGQEEA